MLIDTLSIAIMGCTPRLENIKKLKSILGENTPVALDYPPGHEKNIGIWENAKRAWRAHGNSRWHLVIQDDAIIPENFKELLIEDISEYQDDIALQLFHYPRPKLFAEGNLTSGVAIVLPTRIIEEMISSGDQSKQPNDDNKINEFLRKKGIPVVHTIPCLVQHSKESEIPSLRGEARDRVSDLYIGNLI